MHAWEGASIGEEDEFERFLERIRKIKDPERKEKAKKLLRELWDIIIED